MQLRPVTTLALIITFAVASCSSAGSSSSSGSLAQGMTFDQATAAMGQPDLKDTIADPSHPGTTVPRYVWLETGRVAIFGNDGRVSSIQSIEPAAKQQARAEAAATPARPFDPVQTPLDYAFFPLKAAIIYAGAGLQCVVGGPCSKPRLPYPAS